MAADDGKRPGACGRRLRVAFHSAKRSLEGGCGGENREIFLGALGGLRIFFSHVGVFFRVFLFLFSCCFFVRFLFVVGCFLGAFWEHFWKQNRVKMRLCDFMIFIDFP